MHKLTRRSAFAALPALAVAPTMAAPPASDIRTLYLEWVEFGRVLDDAPASVPEDAFNKAVDQWSALSERAMAIKPETAEDFAYQILMANGHNDINGSQAQIALVANACRLAGEPEPRAPLDIEGDWRPSARRRLEQVAAEQGVSAPNRLTDPDGGPAVAVLEFAREHGVSLDWIYIGPPNLKYLSDYPASPALTSSARILEA